MSGGCAQNVNDGSLYAPIRSPHPRHISFRHRRGPLGRTGLCGRGTDCSGLRPCDESLQSVSRDRQNWREHQSQIAAFRYLSRRYRLSDLEEALAEGIIVGHEGLEMPQFQFSPVMIDALLAYMTSVQAK
jgi:hypothetical protein